MKSLLQEAAKNYGVRAVSVGGCGAYFGLLALWFLSSLRSETWWPAAAIPALMLYVGVVRLTAQVLRGDL